MIAAIVFASCQKMNVQEESVEATSNNSVAKRECGTEEALMQAIAQNPSLRLKMNEIEVFTSKAVKDGRAMRIAADGVIEIPVTVNVLYSNATENISDAQIQSQIDVLNEDFNLKNVESSSVPAEFVPVKANVGIRFVLANIVRKASTKTSWTTANEMKVKTTGIVPTTPTTNLNIWVVNKLVSGTNNILGYAQFPGGSSTTDGVVIAHNYFGRVGTASAAPFNKGRTTTHEVGHWMNLKHIWGDAQCGDDLVGDTPTHNDANYGKPVYPHYSTCASKMLEMTMNFMDYTDDAAMAMFSNGQKQRIMAIFTTGGPRASFAVATTTRTNTRR